MLVDVDNVDHTNLSAAAVWTLESGYPRLQKRTADPERFPFRVFGLGANAGLRIILSQPRSEINYLCSGPYVGFKMLLHTPDEVPQVDKYYIHLPLDQEVLVKVAPRVVTTAAALRGYTPDQRQCFFESERKLLYYRRYSQRNCELECLANLTLSRCGCVNLGMPRKSTSLILG